MTSWPKAFPKKTTTFRSKMNILLFGLSLVLVLVGTFLEAKIGYPKTFENFWRSLGMFVCYVVAGVLLRAGVGE